jgi:phosphoglycerate dehydrogenase-like enzyme
MHTLRQLERKLRFEYVEMEELLKRADFITFHVLLSEKTRHLISAGKGSRMRRAW